jgi:hypothetical protein
MGTELRSSYSDDFKSVVMSTQTADHIIASGDKSFIEPGNFMQPEAPEMFNLRMISGSRTGLKELNSILLNKSLAKRLFGDADPINKIVTIDTKHIVQVSGVYEDFPDNCDFKNVAFIAPWDLFVTSDMQTDDIHKHFDAFRDDLLKTNAIKEVAESNGSVTELWSANGGFNWPGKDPDNKNFTDFGTIGVSRDFGKTIGWQITDGRDLSDKFAGNINCMIVNESAVKYMGLRNPVGEYIQWEGRNYMIAGVIKDMIMESPYKPVTPTVFFLGSWDHATVNLRINPNVSISDALVKIEPVYKRYSGGTPFDYRFADDEYSKKFSAEVRIGKYGRILCCFGYPDQLFRFIWACFIYSRKTN